MNLQVDPERRGWEAEHPTGIVVRAWDEIEEKFRSVDIVELTGASLQEWLTSRGGSNGWAESVVHILLGHKEKRENESGE